MSSSGHHEYDANLLLATPAPTKGMLQSGYTTDLLEEKPKPPRRDDLESARHKSLSRPTSIPNRKVRPDVVEPRAASTTSIPKLSPQKAPFYRTRKGIIILVIASIVILAAVIGGAVGGTIHPQSTAPLNAPSNAPSNTSSNAFSNASSNGQQGLGTSSRNTAPSSTPTSTPNAALTTVTDGNPGGNPGGLPAPTGAALVVTTVTPTRFTAVSL